jgi:hypothetical protein
LKSAELDAFLKLRSTIAVAMYSSETHAESQKIIQIAESVMVGCHGAILKEIIIRLLRGLVTAGEKIKTLVTN